MTDNPSIVPPADSTPSVVAAAPAATKTLAAAVTTAQSNGDVGDSSRVSWKRGLLASELYGSEWGLTSMATMTGLPDAAGVAGPERTRMGREASGSAVTETLSPLPATAVADGAGRTASAAMTASDVAPQSATSVERAVADQQLRHDVQTLWSKSTVAASPQLPVPVCVLGVMISLIYRHLFHVRRL